MQGIDWSAMPHSALKSELQLGLEERDKRIAELEAIAPREAQRIETRGRKRALEAFPERGELDAQ